MSSIEISLKYIILLIHQNLLFDIHIEIDNGEGGLTTSRQIMWWLHFSNCQLPIHQEAISQQHRCMVFTFHKSYVIRCAQHREFLDWDKLLTQKLPKEGCVASSLKSSLEHFYRRHHKLVDRNEISISQRPMDPFSLYVDFSFLYHRKDLYRPLLYQYQQHGECLINNMNCLSFGFTWVHFRLYDVNCIAHHISFLCRVFFSFCLSLFFVLCSLLSVSLNYPTLFVSTIFSNLFIVI